MLENATARHGLLKNPRGSVTASRLVLDCTGVGHHPQLWVLLLWRQKQETQRRWFWCWLGGGQETVALMTIRDGVQSGNRFRDGDVKGKILS